MQQREYDAMAWAEHTHWWFVARRRFIEVFLGVPPSTKLRIADIGAGTGGTTAWLGKYGRVVGIEPSAHARKLAQNRGIRLIRGSAEHTDLPSGSVDLVTILDVLYHRDVDEYKALSEAFRILRPGGTILVTDCAFEWLGGRHHQAVHGARRYTLQQMTSNLKKAGFAVERRSYMFFLTLPLLYVKRLIFPNHLASEVGQMPAVVSFVLRVLCSAEATALRCVSFPLGSSIIVRAKKSGAH